MAPEHVARFWAKADKSGGPNACWNWTACKDKDGYGFFRHQHKNLKAHRVAVALDGRDPSGRMVCHSCDNPSCVNPAHLWLGDNSQNQKDSVSKGRHHGWPVFRGESHGRAKVTAAQVEEIKLLYVPRRVTAAEVGKLYGLSERQVRKIANGHAWQTT